MKYVKYRETWTLRGVDDIVTRKHLVETYAEVNEITIKEANKKSDKELLENYFNWDVENPAKSLWERSESGDVEYKVEIIS